MSHDSACLTCGGEFCPGAERFKGLCPERGRVFATSQLQLEKLKARLAEHGAAWDPAVNCTCEVLSAADCPGCVAKRASSNVSTVDALNAVAERDPEALVVRYAREVLGIHLPSCRYAVQQCLVNIEAFRALVGRCTGSPQSWSCTHGYTMPHADTLCPHCCPLAWQGSPSTEVPLDLRLLAQKWCDGNHNNTSARVERETLEALLVRVRASARIEASALVAVVRPSSSR